MLLENQISALRNYMSEIDKTNPHVSKSTVGWQIDHSLRVICGVIDSLEQSSPSDYKPKFSVFKILIMGSGKIPRGRAKAPKVIQNNDPIQKEELQKLLDKTITKLKKVPSLPKDSNFKHPMFGSLSKKQTERFIAIHTNHHLKIIEDMLS